MHSVDTKTFAKITVNCEAIYLDRSTFCFTVNLAFELKDISGDIFFNSVNFIQIIMKVVFSFSEKLQTFMIMSSSNLSMKWRQLQQDA